MVGPAYLHVPDGKNSLWVAVSRQSQRPQIVRIGAAHLPNKTSTICGFSKIELRPDHRQSTGACILAQGAFTYWLAVQVFSHSDSGWHQSILRANGALTVPALVMAFDVGSPRESDRVDVTPSVTLSVTYGESPIG